MANIDHKLPAEVTRLVSELMLQTTYAAESFSSEGETARTAEEFFKVAAARRKLMDSLQKYIPEQPIHVRLGVDIPKPPKL